MLSKLPPLPHCLWLLLIQSSFYFFRKTSGLLGPKAEQLNNEVEGGGGGGNYLIFHFHPPYCFSITVYCFFILFFIFPMLRANARKLIGKLFYVALKEFIKTIQVPN